MFSFQQVRWKHSNTQIKRIFRNNPARLRVMKKNGIFPKVGNIPETKYPAILEPKIMENGWSAPPGPEVTIPEYPFSVSRSSNKPKNAPGFLPVYSKYRKDGTKVSTEIRKVTGDKDAFISELRATLQIPETTNKATDPVRIRAGSIEVDGNHVRQLKSWLASLGF